MTIKSLSVEVKKLMSRRSECDAFFPVLPIALLIIFSKLVVTSVKLDTVAALFMVWVFVVIVELIRLRDVKKIFKDGMAMFQAMGKMFTGIVALIICAEFFATGLKTSASSTSSSIRPTAWVPVWA